MAYIRSTGMDSILDAGTAKSRAASEIIGFVLLFATIIILLSFWQAFIIPSETENTESSHQLQVENDLRELRDTIELSRQSRTNHVVGVQLGPRYGDRILFANPPPQAGSIRTVAENSDISITNVTVSDGEPVGTAAFWQSSRTLSTSLLAYDVSYSELGYDPSYRLENSFLYGRFDGQLLGLTEPKWIDGTDIRLTAFSGMLSENHNREQRIQVTSNSPASRSVTVESDDGPVTIRFPTLLSQSEWQEYLNTSQARHVEQINISSGSEYNTATVTLNASHQYDIDLAQVGIGTGRQSTNPAYLASPTGDKSVYAGSTTTLSAEVRDEFDNVLTSETVTFEATYGAIETGDSTAGSQTLTTGSQGTVRIKYVAPEQGVAPDGTDIVTISHPDAAVENIELAIDIIDTGETVQSSVRWRNESVELLVGDTTTLVAEDNREIDGAPVSFGVQNRSILGIDSSDSNFEEGTASLDITAQRAGERIYAYVSSFDSGDRLPVDILYSDWVWETVTDWAEGSNERTATDNIGDREADTVRLGYELDSGLVGYWPFDEDSGQTAIDWSGLNNNGTQQNNPGLAQAGVLSSTAYQFDGSSSFVTVPHDESLEMSSEDAVTVSMWVNQNEDLEREWTALFQKSDTSYNLQLNSNNEPEFTIHDGDWQSAVSGVSLQQDRWYHIVGTYDGSEIRIYVDGELEGTGSVSGQMTDASNSDVGIGENLDETGRHFDGRIDEVRVYDRSLGDSAVQRLYQTTENGTHTTGWKTGPRQLNSSQLALNGTVFDLNGGRVNVTVQSRTNGVIETSDPVQLQPGVDQYEVSGISSDSREFRLLVEIETDDPTATPVVSRLELTDDGPEQSILDLDSFDITDKYNTQEFDVPVTVSETNAVETTNFELSLQFEDAAGDTVYNETIDSNDIGELSAETDSVTFGQEYGTERIGPLEQGDYGVTATATASNAESVTQQTSFTVSQTQINFQPPESERNGATPSGYLADEGDQFGVRESGLRYGWIGEANGEYRERGTDNDQRRDTLIHMDQGSVAGGVDWQLDVSDAVYNITLVMGDPSYQDQNNTVRIGDELLVDEDGNGGDNFDVYETAIEVTDGSFRIEPVETSDGGGGTSDLGNQKLDYIDFEVVETDTDTP